jgi:cation:H+ antiporter
MPGTLSRVPVPLELFAAFVLIVGGALGFTNAVEWLGHRLNLGAGAVGALLAAVGTALPESVIPVVALVSSSSGDHAVDIAIGAIVGAPFMLATVAMVLVALSAFTYRGRREQGRTVTVERSATRRDLLFFLALFPVAIVLGAIGVPLALRIAAAVAMLTGYAAYTWRTIKGAGGADGDEELRTLFFDASRDDPPSNPQIGVQFALSLAAIVGGAELFVRAIESIAASVRVSSLVLALVLAPLATELPEKVNSVLWVRQGKDVLAVGNITGAMAFQATIPVALGLVVTAWDLEPAAIVAACVALAGATLSLWVLPNGRTGLAPTLAWAGLFAGFVAYVSLA